MKYRVLGNSGLRVSELGFGTGDNAGLMVLGTEKDRLKATERALELGINYFDTSPDYGKGVAETNLGAALRQLKPKDAIVATKVEIMPPDLDTIHEKVLRSLDESLKRLGMDRVDLLLIHNPPRLKRNPSIQTWTPITPDDMAGPALDAMKKLRAAGKVRYFGFACEGAEPIATKPLLESGEFSVINSWFSLVNPTAGIEMPAGVKYGEDYENYDGIITHAHKHNVGVAAIRPLAGGALVEEVIAQGIAGRHPLSGGGFKRNPERFRPEHERGKPFAFLSNAGRSLPQAGFRFILDNPGVSTICGGFSAIEHLEELAKVSDMPPLTEGERAQIKAIYTRNFDLAS
jgi:aryl-alcohol dehydrogenase-like predicted oxidoreductase